MLACPAHARMVAAVARKMAADVARARQSPTSWKQAWWVKLDPSVAVNITGREASGSRFRRHLARLRADVDAGRLRPPGFIRPHLRRVLDVFGLAREVWSWRDLLSLNWPRRGGTPKA